MDISPHSTLQVVYVRIITPHGVLNSVIFKLDQLIETVSGRSAKARPLRRVSAHCGRRSRARLDQLAALVSQPSTPVVVYRLDSLWQLFDSRRVAHQLPCASVASVRGGILSIDGCSPGSWIRGGSEAQVVFSKYR